MDQYQAVFERAEKKYLLPPAQYRALRALLDQHMRGDEFGLHTVSSVYMDTENYNVIRESLSKPKYKEKVRLRSYGTPGKDDTVYLELKKKVHGIVYKRRMGLPLREAERYLQAGVRPSRRGQIFDEIDWSLRRTGARPRAVISCDRLALYGTDNPGFRVTFDFRMRFRDHDLSLSKGSGGAFIIDPAKCLMEIKTEHPLPLWLTAFLSEHRIFPTSFSKYGTAYRNYLQGRKEGELRNVG